MTKGDDQVWCANRNAPEAWPNFRQMNLMRAAKTQVGRPDALETDALKAEVEPISESTLAGKGESMTAAPHLGKEWK